ncbi:MAG: response regulator transcription factor [Victivallales bacterium]|jgi:DNA-binding NarL/FixJ family response regulator
MSISVYLIDDHRALLDALKAVFKGHPEISIAGEATSAKNCMDELIQLKPDVVTLDLFMENENGIDFLKELKKRDLSIKTVVFTGSSSEEHVAECFSYGTLGYVLKGGGIDELVDAVIAAGKGNYYLSGHVGKTFFDQVKFNEKRLDKGKSEGLSQREKEVLKLTGEGKSCSEIAEILKLELSSVYTYRNRLMNKLGVKNASELIAAAVKAN